MATEYTELTRGRTAHVTSFVTRSRQHVAGVARLHSFIMLSTQNLERKASANCYTERTAVWKQPTGTSDVL